MSPGKILLVEDEPKLVHLLRRVLTATNFQVLATGRGETALELAALEQPDLVVLDLVLDGALDGYAVARPAWPRSWRRSSTASLCPSTSSPRPWRNPTSSLLPPRPHRR
jgi:DNA-binding response OmpR family regulator